MHYYVNISLLIALEIWHNVAFDEGSAFIVFHIFFYIDFPCTRFVLFFHFALC